MVSKVALSLLLIKLSPWALAEVRSPSRLSFTELSSTTNANDGFFSALATNGLLSITNVPGDFAAKKRKLLANLATCLSEREIGEVGVSIGSRAVLEDGSVRTSLAWEEDALSELDSLSLSCHLFRTQVDSFRAMVDSVIQTFVHRLSFEMTGALEHPLMDGINRVWEDVEDMVSEGQFLEHFHSYQKLQQAYNIHASSDSKTIDFHTDQGFILAFTPGMMVHIEKDLGQSTVQQLSDGFYIQDSTGKNYEVEFQEDDDLVFMMGDGVNQYLNNKLHHERKYMALHATPHALTLTTSKDNAIHRVWYGRMILPPKDAFVSDTRGSRITFGELRRSVIDYLTANDTEKKSYMAGIGCSSPKLDIGMHGISPTATVTSRQLVDNGHDGDASQCATDELFCWFKCMALADQNLTTTTCSERNLQLQCANPRDQVLVDGKGYGDYYPACTNSTETPTDFPMIDQQDNLTCPELWEEFLTSNEEYDHMANLTNPMGTETHLMWSVTNENKIKARLVYNNVFGFLAMGFANLDDTYYNGMLGASILLAIPGGNYSPVTGLNMSEPGSIGTYVIDEAQTPFRIWMEPVEWPTDAQYVSTECFTSIMFESDHINNKSFNIDGSDEMIWGGNAMDYFVAYHGPFDRRRFTVEWKTGNVTFFSATKVTQEEKTKSSGSFDNYVPWIASLIGLASSFMLA